MTLFHPIEPLQSADVPEKKTPNWKLMGPGAVLVGLSIGAGEIIIWPRIVAEYGSSMVWAAIVGVFLQMWINLEIGRWTIATGETVYTGYCRMWRGFAFVFIGITIFAWIAPGWGRASGSALKALVGFLLDADWQDNKNWVWSDTLWTTITFVFVALALFGPKLVYRSVERTVEALVVIVVIGLIAVAIAVGTSQTWKELGIGMVQVGHVEESGRRRLNLNEEQTTQFKSGVITKPLCAAISASLELKNIDDESDLTITKESDAHWSIRVTDTGQTYPVTVKELSLIATTPAITAKAFFIALVFAGAGGTANLFYTFYLRDKHIGMGARIPSMHNPLHGKTGKTPTTGFTYVDNNANRGRFRKWLSFVRADQGWFFFGLNSVTILLFIFGALAVLRPEGIVPGKGTLVWDEAAVLEKVWGSAGRVTFLCVGLATLFSTQLALIDGVARSMADLLYTNFSAARKRDVGWWYLIVAGIWILAGCVITFIMEGLGVSELGFLFNAAYIGGFAMAIYVPLTLYMNLRHLPKSAKPGWFSIAMMVIASCVYVGFAVFCLVSEVRVRIGG